MNRTHLEQDDILTEDRIRLVNYLPHIGIEQVRKEIWKGLTSSPKYISSKYFYDKNGSELFEAITKLDEYYPTRTEKKILSGIGKDLNIQWGGLNIIELGSGDHSKIRLLLQHVPEQALSAIKYYPVDISQSAIEKAAGHLSNEFPMIQINGIVADFIHHLNLMPKTANRLFCFFGSTIGNLDRTETRQFLQRLGAEMQPGDHLLLGMDMVKDRGVLERAYNDSQHITAEFNKNILNVVNRAIKTDFDPDAFDHLAFFNEKERRIEMHLRAQKDMVVSSGYKPEKIYLKQGKTIHTENSHKFTPKDIEIFARWAGLETAQIFTDPRKWFSLVVYVKKGERI